MGKNLASEFKINYSQDLKDLKQGQKNSDFDEAELKLEMGIMPLRAFRCP